MIPKLIHRRQRQINEAEGYSMLGMEQHALAALDLVPEADRDHFDYQVCRGEILRKIERHAEALVFLERAHALKPKDIGVLMALAWCYKRTDQISRAIATNEEAYQISPNQPILLYNLACYCALAGDTDACLAWLARALRMDRSYRKLIPDETDFDSVRNDPQFRKLVELTNPEQTD
jgi:tetratricopeptide (TPR) repeat protein